MISRRQNSIQVSIGGSIKTMKFGMQAQERFTEIIQSQKDGANGFMSNITSVLGTLFEIGLKNSKNELPENFNKEMVFDWIDEMDDEQFEIAKEFAFQAMGFTVEEMKRNATALEKNLSN